MNAGAFKKGEKRPNQGRPPGRSNNATLDARKAIADFVDGNAHRLVEWLDRIAEDNPAKAFELYQSVIEYHVPKLARSELVGDPAKPLQQHLKVTFE